MHDQLAARPRAIRLRLAGRSVKAICAAVGRSEEGGFDANTTPFARAARWTTRHLFSSAPNATLASTASHRTTKSLSKIRNPIDYHLAWTKYREALHYREIPVFIRAANEAACRRRG
jgi:hypothetical protein